MSRTYIGPFGRILPIPGDSTSPSPSEGSPSRMIAHQPLLLPLPTRLDFGSDPRPGFTDPNRYETMAGLQRGFHSSRAEPIGPLPPVSQLLSPVSPVGEYVPSLPLRFGVMPPAERGIGYFSPRVNDHGRPQYARTEGNMFDVQHTSAPHILAPHLQPSYTTSTRPVAPTSTGYPPILQTYGGGSNLMHTNSPDASRQAWQSLPPNADFSNHQWHPAQRAEYRSSPTSSSMSGQSSSEIQTTPKPTLKVVGEKAIPGEGPCYLYEDGTHVRKFIDGEVVNAKWGVTKAGKARKRLAMACAACREKKIKCEPGEVKCAQCDKSGRDCRFVTAACSQSSASGSNSYEQQAYTSSEVLSEPKYSRSNDVRRFFLDVHTLLPSLSLEQRSLYLNPPTTKRPLDAQNDQLQSRTCSDWIQYRPFGSPEQKAKIQASYNQDDVKTITNITIDLREPSSWPHQKLSSRVVQVVFPRSKSAGVLLGDTKLRFPSQQCHSDLIRSAEFKK